jgi:hypothetical protein
VIHHFINLLTRAWVLCVVWMGTSTLAVVVAVVIFLIVVAVGLWKNRSDWKAAMRSALVAAAVTVGVWLLLYASAIVDEIVRTFDERRAARGRTVSF